MKLTPKSVMISSTILLIVIATSSYIFKDHSQVLPAVVKTEKLMISSKTSGYVQEYFPTLNSVVKPGDPILNMFNSKMLSELKNQINLRAQYDQIIESASNGDKLEFEMIDIEEKILKSKNAIEECKIELQEVKSSLAMYKAKYDSSSKQYNAWKELYATGDITTVEYDNYTENIIDDIADYNDLKNDSIRTVSRIILFEDELSLLQKTKNLLSTNASLLASKQQLELENINNRINELETNMDNLQINSPVHGIVTGTFFKQGEKVESGDVIAEVATMEKIWIVAYGNSASRQKIKLGQEVTIMCNNRTKLFGSVVSVSPVMEKVKSLSNTYETVNTFSKIEIKFNDERLAKDNLTPGERLFVRVELQNNK
jgi:multidrug resistance efflux pump